MIINACFVAIGGALGAVCRYLIGVATGYLTAQISLPAALMSFPLATFIANMCGCFLIGFLSVFFEQSTQTYAAHLKLFAITGVLGGFTTFSTFSLETIMLFQDGSYGLGLSNVLFTLAVCLAGVVLGRMAGQMLFLKA